MLARIHRLSKQRDHNQEKEYGKDRMLGKHSVDTHGIKSSMMTIKRTNDAEQNACAKHADKKYLSEIASDRFEYICQAFAEKITAKEQNQKCANDYEHMRNILKPLFAKVNRA